MSTLAILLLLGGSAYAVAKINGKRLKGRSVAGKKLKKDTVSGVEVDEATLGKVPSAASADTAGTAGTAANAQALDGIDSQGFVRGSQEVRSARVYPGPGAEVTVFNVSSVGRIRAQCSANAQQITWTYHNTTSGPRLATMDRIGESSAAAITGSYTLPTGSFSATTQGASSATGHRVIASAYPYRGSNGPAGTFVLTGNRAPGSDPHCAIQGYVVVSG